MNLFKRLKQFACDHSETRLIQNWWSISGIDRDEHPGTLITCVTCEKCDLQMTHAETFYRNPLVTRDTETAQPTQLDTHNP